MPGNIHAMSAFAPNDITYQVKTRPQRKDRTRVPHRECQPAIAVMASDKEIEAFPSDPTVDFRMSELLPGERTRWFRLAHAIYANCVVHRGSAEQVPLRTIPHILKRARI